MYTKINSQIPQIAKAIVVSSDISDLTARKLEKMNIEIIHSFKNEQVNPILSKHADMQMVHISDNNYICAPACYDYYKQHLKKYSVNLFCGNTDLSSNYPDDIAYNIIITENFAVHNFKYTDSKLKAMLNNKNIIDVSQGYCGCTVCKISDNAFITSDDGVIKKMSSFDCDILKISPGNIVLEGFDTGFIGGCSFMISKTLLVMNGDLSSHPDSSKIEAFCGSHGVEVLSFSDEPLTDIGSAVAIA